MTFEVYEQDGLVRVDLDAGAGKALSPREARKRAALVAQLADAAADTGTMVNLTAAGLGDCLLTPEEGYGLSEIMWRTACRINFAAEADPSVGRLALVEEEPEEGPVKVRVAE